MTEIILKVIEIPQQHVGRGRAIIDPKIIATLTFLLFLLIINIFI